MPFVLIVGVAFFLYSVTIVLKIQYLSLFLLPLLIYVLRKYARVQKKSKDDLIDTYFLFNSQPKYLEDTTNTMSKIKGKKR